MTMADNTIHDLLDEVNCADSCEAVTALCALIDELLKDIQHLELECIGTRYLLSQHMEEEQGSLLCSDILVKIAVLAHTARSTRAILPKQESHLAGWLN